MRGQGLEIKTRYKWARQPNGNYTIFDVPIFSIHTETGITKNGEQYELIIDLDCLRRAVDNFKSRRKKEGYYPRLHIGHQDKQLNISSNAPGVGYLDNLYEAENMIYSDLVEIMPVIFQEIRNDLKYPYLSSEYNWKIDSVEGLALLESRPPQFKLPILALEPSETPLEAVEEYIFSLREQVIHFQEERKNMAIINTLLKPGAENPAETPGKDSQDPAEKPPGEGGEESGMMGYLKKIVEMLEMLIKKDEKVHEKIELQGEGVKPEDPSSVAMQASIDKLLQAQEQQNKLVFDRLAKIEGLRIEDESESRLRLICKETGADFEGNRKVLRDFQDLSSKTKFLDYLETSSQRHFQADAPPAIQKISEKRQLILEKYKEKPGHVQEVARFAIRDFQETLASGGYAAEALKAQFGEDCEDFVASMTRQEEAAPGFYKREILKER